MKSNIIQGKIYEDFQVLLNLLQYIVQSIEIFVEEITARSFSVLYVCHEDFSMLLPNIYGIVGWQNASIVEKRFKVERT